MDRKYDVITLGEILLRLSTPINGRLAQGDTLMKHLGGAELNIASEIGQLGLKTAMISKIPNNLLAAFIKNQMNASRVSENYLISDTADDSRIGVYYYEYGSYPRKPRVVYDRKHSSINNIDIKDVPETMFYNTRLLHTSGITLGLGGNHRDRVLLAERLLDFLDRACFAESQACGIFGAEEDIYIRKNLLDAGSCLLAGPEIGTVVDIKRDQGSLDIPVCYFITRC